MLRLSAALPPPPPTGAEADCVSSLGGVPGEDKKEGFCGSPVMLELPTAVDVAAEGEGVRGGRGGFLCGVGGLDRGCEAAAAAAQWSSSSQQKSSNSAGNTAAASVASVASVSVHPWKTQQDRSLSDVSV